jgi:hypothetical protein
MLLAKNVVVHDPETDLVKIDRERMQANGWPLTVADFVDKARSESSVPALKVLEEAVRESAAAPSSGVTPPPAGSKGTE